MLQSVQRRSQSYMELWDTQENVQMEAKLALPYHVSSQNVFGVDKQELV